MPSTPFLTREEEQRVVEAIARAETRTSGEIRVHLEEHCNRDPLERAARVFHELGMDQTERQNGVLIYVAVEDHKVAVYAGKGIHKQVEDEFWDDLLKVILDHFREGRHEEGLTEAVNLSAAKLQEMYPHHSGVDNELSNEISYHRNRTS